jgi:hypothetical protein
MTSLIPWIKHPLILLHHMWYLDAETPTCSSSMHGSSWLYLAIWVRLNGLAQSTMKLAQHGTKDSGSCRPEACTGLCPGLTFGPLCQALHDPFGWAWLGLMAIGSCPSFILGPVGRHDMAHFYCVSCRASSPKARARWLDIIMTKSLLMLFQLPSCLTHHFMSFIDSLLTTFFL